MNALACMFLLSTGDDEYVPRVKQYFAQFLQPDGGVKGIGTHTWHNGYNGAACAEYYLRTGDESVLPILQYYCDDARDRQNYGVGWGHWGHGINPAYEAGGGMQHAAGNQILLTLVLGKLCGVDVDDKTLLGALKHWYRFVGHGTVPYGDHRGEGGFLVMSVRDGSGAHRIGIRTGDLILAINGRSLEDGEALRRSVLDLRGHSRAQVVVQRGAGRYNVNVPLI